MKILFLQTGGTIDKDYPVKRGSYHFEIGDPAVEKILDKVLANFDYEVKSVLKKDSLDINDEDRKEIFDVCEKSKFNKIIITHGTDTMVDTARVLSSIKDKIIILTGSILPWAFKGTDSDFNIGTAVGAVNLLPPGVYIAMSGVIYKWDEVEKNDKGNRFIFKDKKKNI